MNRTKIYTLFPSRRSYSAKPSDYCGTELHVAATSVRQAYAVAHKDIWISPEERHPVGIVSIYEEGVGIRLWCGCAGPDVKGGQVRHGVGIKALRQAIETHDCPHKPKDLLTRLKEHRR